MRVVLLLLALVGCAIPPVTPIPAAYVTGTDPAPLSAVQPGMNQAGVQALLGQPDQVDRDTDWKLVAAAFYPGPNMWRLVYRYRGKGRVIFACGVQTADGRVVAVEEDAAELQP